MAPAPASLTIPEFQAKWRNTALTERSAAQSHFNDLCSLVGAPTPSSVDQDGSTYSFERRVRKLDGKIGFADVWRKEHFVWEYKAPGANLSKAFDQILYYRDDLENPPLLIVSDIKSIAIRTNFNNTPPATHEISIDDLADPAKFEILRFAFFSPQRLRPAVTVDEVSVLAADNFASLAGQLERRGTDPRRTAHFLVQVLFCLFAEDVGLLERKLFTELLEHCVIFPDEFPEQMQALFLKMREGGNHVFRRIPRFNGGLFSNIDALSLTKDELRILVSASKLDWGSISPAIIGTLFERSLDPGQRRRLGAHYTSREDIERVVEPVLMEPLRKRWASVREEALTLKEHWEVAQTQRERSKRRSLFVRKLTDFQHELTGISILDPACGSGNFLYVALAMLHDLEYEISRFGANNGITAMLPMVSPTQLHGLEVNPYARELAQVVVWIGHIQWMRANGFGLKLDPVIDSIETIDIRDALIRFDESGGATEVPWPNADFVIGNPPFLGAKRMRAELGDRYTDAIHQVFAHRLPSFSDLVCYFFEKARAQVAAGNAKRVGLLATSSIRGGANRVVLDRIKQTGDIFMAWDDQPWILDGASVHISIVGFDDGTQAEKTLNGTFVPTITSALRSGVDFSVARPLRENSGVCYVGVQLSGPFIIPGDIARTMLAEPENPNGRPNSDVVKPMINGLDIARRPRDQWVIDFGVNRSEQDAALYEAPFEFVKANVKPMRSKSRSQQRDPRWWLFLWPRSEMRAAISNLERYLVTPTVSKHRIFSWVPAGTIANHAVVVFARNDDYFFGVMHSRAHEIWSLRMGTSLEDRPRYTPSTCFESFPFPWKRQVERPNDDCVMAIALAAKQLNALREAWLNPPDGSPETLKNRTLTNLYNQRFAWLDHAHAKLDRAVWDAYGWTGADPDTDSDEEILERLLSLNVERATRRFELDDVVIGGLNTISGVASCNSMDASLTENIKNPENGVLSETEANAINVE